ncbi:MAG: PAS-domain containing protein [Gammaproteobacteria bacterium]
MTETALLLALLALAYGGLLFAIAWLGDRFAAQGRFPFPRPWVYSLSLAVYCTSWAFYGTVGQSATLGWWFPPTYVGTLLLFVFGLPFLRKVIGISSRHRITSIADFIGARFGRDRTVATLVSLIALVALVPYVALQLKAIDLSFAALAGGLGSGGAATPDSGLVVTLVLALFASLFGARQVDATEHHPGMMLALAFESLIKLVVFLAVGLFATFVLFDGPFDLAARVAAQPEVVARREAGSGTGHYAALVVLGFFAIFCLPRQFHVAVVENSGPRDLATARWAFPLYLVAISLFILPVANAGLAFFPPGQVAPDLFVLAVPLGAGQDLLAVLAFLGGLSAATGMVIVASVALATMISNEMVLPLLLRAGRHPVPAGTRPPDRTRTVLLARRSVIFVLLLVAWAYYRMIAGDGALAQIGEISMAAVALFGPVMLAGVYWRSATRVGALAALGSGFAVWGWTLLVPTLAMAGLVPSAWLATGPGDLAWLRPTALFGWLDWNPLAHGLAWSLAVSTGALVLVSLLTRRSLVERIQAAAFVDAVDSGGAEQYRGLTGALTVHELRVLAAQFVGPQRASEHFSRLGAAGLPGGSPATAEQLDSVQTLLGSVIGAASARRVMDAALSGGGLPIEDVVSLVGSASQALEFGREQLLATLENLTIGVSVVDADLRLVAWNRAYVALYALPPDLLRVGRPVADVLWHTALRGDMGQGDPRELVERRLAHLRRRTPYVFERLRPEGRVLEIRGNPMPGGGFVTTYTDITDFKQTAAALLEVNERLEARVAQRTAALSAVNSQLQEAKAAAESANLSKTRFLAAASHDLLQPLHAAGLFSSALQQQLSTAPSAQRLAADLEQCLRAAEGVLTDLLDISRLDAGVIEVQSGRHAAEEFLAAIDAEFRLDAAARGVHLRLRHCSAWVETDARLLRRVLQNLVGNALRYTAARSVQPGRERAVLVGCRHRRDHLRFEVWDTGIGIATEHLDSIFEEFFRAPSADRPPVEASRGFGLGLAIVQRIAKRLGVRVTVRSEVGRGSVFLVEVPLAEANLPGAAATSAEVIAEPALTGLPVLVLENDAEVLRGMEALLGSWGCVVRSGATLDAALPVDDGWWPAVAVVDYHLDGGITGLDEIDRLLGRLGNRSLPAVVVVSADAGPGIRERVAAAGARWLPKPVKPLALRSLLRGASQAGRISAAAVP